MSTRSEKPGDWALCLPQNRRSRSSPWLTTLMSSLMTIRRLPHLHLPASMTMPWPKTTTTTRARAATIERRLRTRSSRRKSAVSCRKASLTGNRCRDGGKSAAVERLPHPQRKVTVAQARVPVKMTMTAKFKKSSQTLQQSTNASSAGGSLSARLS